MPLYVRVTIDGAYDELSLSGKVLPDEWSQPKQKLLGKTQEALQLKSSFVTKSTLMHSN